MPAYFPEVIDGAEGLRRGVEGVLSGENPEPINDQIRALHGHALAAGLRGTFAAEVEYKFLSLDPDGEPVDKDRMYLDVVEEVLGKPAPIRSYPKGAMLRPEDHPDPILLNDFIDGTFNPDQPGTDISEIRTAPADPLEAIERYWKVVGAIGKVAARNGCVGLVLATHINAAVLSDYGLNSWQITPLHSRVGRSFLAATQHNINAMYGLQIDAGLMDGFVVSEAFPHTKDAPTTVHEERAELRHALVGVADPRVDILAALDGLVQTARGTVPKHVLDASHRCASVKLYQGPPDIADALSRIVYWDYRSKKFVMPAELNEFNYATWPSFVDNISKLITMVTHEDDPDIFADNAFTLRRIVKALRLSKDSERLEVDPDSPYAAELERVFRYASCFLMGNYFRVIPEVISDSPEEHLTRRKFILSSSTVRRILGSAAASLVSAEESVARRDALIATTMMLDE